MDEGADLGAADCTCSSLRVDGESDTMLSLFEWGWDYLAELTVQKTTLLSKIPSFQTSLRYSDLGRAMTIAWNGDFGLGLRWLTVYQCPGKRLLALVI